jgi:hypothetical protein
MVPTFEQQDLSFFFLNQSDWRDGAMEYFLLQNQPHLGAFSLMEWNLDSNFFAYVVTWNDTAAHSLPILFNAMSNAQLNGASNDSVIETFVSPLGQAIDFQVVSARVTAAFTLTISFVLPPIGFISQVVADKSSGYSRQLQVMGLSRRAYWISTFLTNYSMFLFMAINTFVSVVGFRGVVFGGPAFPAFVLTILTSQVR